MKHFKILVTCFSAAVVMRTRLSVALCVHCLSCNLHFRYFGVILNASRRIVCESVIMTQLCRNTSLNTFGTFQREMHFECVLLTRTKHVQQFTSVPVGYPTVDIHTAPTTVRYPNVLFTYPHCAPACNRPTEL